MKKTSDMSTTGMVVTIVALLFAAVVMFTGSVTVTVSDSGITMKAMLTSSSTISVSDIEEVRYLDTFDGGSRVFGVGSAQLKTGSFKNDTFGMYTRYTYAGNDSVIVIRVKGSFYVVNQKTEEETQELYEQILAVMS